MPVIIGLREEGHIPIRGAPYVFVLLCVCRSKAVHKPNSARICVSGDCVSGVQEQQHRPHWGQVRLSPRWHGCRYASQSSPTYVAVPCTDMYVWTIKEPHLPYKTDLDVMQSHPLRRTHFGLYQASSAMLGWHMLSLKKFFSCYYNALETCSHVVSVY